MADQISDAVLDAIYQEDPLARVASETALTTGLVLVMGEISTNCYVTYPRLLDKPSKKLAIIEQNMVLIVKPVPLLHPLMNNLRHSIGVDKALGGKTGEMSSSEIEAIGAGDQGMMFGYATNETSEYMPMPISLAHKLTKKLSEVRKSGELEYLLPDGRSQVTVEYENDKPIRVDTVVLSTQHTPDVSLEQIREDVIEKIIKPVIPAEFIDEDTKYFINPTGRFCIGGPQGDAG